MHHFASAVIEYAESLVKKQACSKQWQQGVRQCLIRLDNVTHCYVESTVAKLGW